MFFHFLKEKPSKLLPALSFPKAETLSFSFVLFSKPAPSPLCWYSWNGEMMFQKNVKVMFNFLSPPRELPPASDSLYLAWDPRQAFPRNQSSFPSTPIFLQWSPVTTPLPWLKDNGIARTSPKASMCQSLSLGLFTSPKTSFRASTWHRPLKATGNNEEETKDHKRGNNS